MAVSLWGMLILSILAPVVSEGTETGANLPWTFVALAVAGTTGVVVGLGGYLMWSGKSRNH